MRAKHRVRSFRSVTERIEGKARAEAERQARGVPWLTLFEFQKQYVEWETFTLWVHAIEEAASHAPGWLRKAVEANCPGIKVSRGTRLWKCLDNWKRQTVFAKPKAEGWMRAVSFFAARDLAYSATWAYWAYCERCWTAERRHSYPSFAEWKSSAEACPDEVLDLSGVREERKELIKAAKRAGAECLQRAVATYLDVEAFAYWLRPFLDEHLPLPVDVRREMENRYPSFEMRDSWKWDQMWAWLKNSQFQEAQAARWFDAVVYTAELHPRRVNVVDYHSLYWSKKFRARQPSPYPPFESWRHEAENYRPAGSAVGHVSRFSSDP